MWWLIFEGDILMRKEHVMRLKLRVEAAADTHPQSMEQWGYSPAIPWDYVWVMAATDDKFWDSRVRDRALRLKGGFMSKAGLTDKGFGVVQF